VSCENCARHLSDDVCWKTTKLAAERAFGAINFHLVAQERVSQSLFRGALSRGGPLRRALVENVVGFLSFSGMTGDHLNELRRFRDREWEQVLPWLHDAGLALYLLQRLKDTNATNILPSATLSRLEENLAANRRRVAYLAGEFDVLNKKLSFAGVRYAVVKGFSLVPQFCPDASLRHQSDFDYLVDNQSLALAQTVLEDTGYSLQKRKTNELIFLRPSAGMPPPADEQYEAHSAHAVDLRCAFWDQDIHGVSLAEPAFSVDNVETHRWQELAFRALSEEDAFLLQVIHAFNHILTGWVRMCWLYEIGYFLDRRSTDRLLWERIERRIGGEPLLREMVVVVVGLSRHLFRAPIPSTSRIWAKELRHSVGIWIQNYARTWAFARNRVDQLSLFSASKVVLFLHQQYLPDASARRHLSRIRLLPWEHLFRRAHSITASSSANAVGRGPQLKRVLIRVLFHLTGGLRYLWELPRWRRLNKATATFPSTNRDSAATDPVGAKSPEPTILA
jgi:hypothetical protein